MSGTICERSLPAFSATSTLLTESLLISPAASALLSASLLTAAATTANPLPCSPARAASMAAFRASRSVCRAISSTMAIFSAMVLIALTVSSTAWPPSFASCADLTAIFSVCWALSAFWRILEAICSMEDEASSAADACSLAPCDISSAVELICSLPAATLAAAACTSATIARSFLIMLRMASASMPISSFCTTSMSAVRSPSATLTARSTPFLRALVMLLANRKKTAKAAPKNRTAAMNTTLRTSRAGARNSSLGRERHTLQPVASTDAKPAVLGIPSNT